uniref:Uncharacterized protein n=1 Tax=viral metagenome TaxID=1070528 RepID=A0A6M3IZQ0_9ZZZZ
MKSEPHKNFDKKIAEHYKDKETSLSIEMTPREIWEIAKELLNEDAYKKYFCELEQGTIREIWYRGAKIVRKEKT